MYKLFLAYNYLYKRRIAYFAVAAVALCVAMVLVVHSVMNGFVETVKNSSRRLLGDVILEVGGTESFPYYDEFIDRVRVEMGDDVIAAAPVIMNYGLLKIMDPLGVDRDRTSPVLVNGIRLAEFRKINSFGEGLYYDTYFPGTTTLREAPQPTRYEDENGITRLPDEYESALNQYRQDHPDSPELAKELAVHSHRTTPGFFAIDSVEQMEEYRRTGDVLHRQYRDNPLPGVIIGVEMVGRRVETGLYERFYPKGTKVVLMLLAMTQSGSPAAGDPTTRVVMRYVDDSRTKVFEIDKQAVYCNFEYLQELLNLGSLKLVDGGETAPRAMQIQIKLAPGVDYRLARDQVADLWEDFMAAYAPLLEQRDVFNMKNIYIRSWEDRNRDFINAVEKERILVLILFAIVSVVAVVLVGCIFYMIVQEKTRDIGIIKSMGATSRGVAGIFLTYAFAVGVVGSVLGTVVGVLFVTYINEFQDFIATLHPGLRVWSPETYSFDRIPSEIPVFDTAMIVLVAILASIVGSLIAARRASKVWPVDAIRYE